jgi:hypothetical protein
MHSLLGRYLLGRNDLVATGFVEKIGSLLVGAVYTECICNKLAHSLTLPISRFVTITLTIIFFGIDFFNFDITQPRHCVDLETIFPGFGFQSSWLHLFIDVSVLPQRYLCIVLAVNFYDFPYLSQERLLYPFLK